MKINGPFGTGSTAGSQRTAKKNTANFTALLSDAQEAEASDTVYSTSAVSGATILLQNTDDEGGQKQAFQYGSDLLNTLKDLQLDLLTGGVSRLRLELLQAQINNKTGMFAAVAPALQGLIADIELRVAVELAKFPD